MVGKPKTPSQVYKPRYLGWLVHKIQYDPETGKIKDVKTEVQINTDLIKRANNA